MKRALLFVSAILLIGGFSASQYYRNNRSHAGEAQAASAVGEKVYLESCAACHGERGDGKGPEASRLKTKPRDFTGGIYKFRTTPSGSLPLDQDILRTITQGVRGTSMLGQLHLSEQERWAVVQYLKTFSRRFKEQKAGEAIAIPPAPSSSSKLIGRGRAKYEEAGCAQCHGPTGKGDVPSAQDLKDEWGNPIPAADLTVKPFKSGSDPRDLYRTLSTGLNGTPMPSYSDAFTPEERWALVFYVLSIATREQPRGMMGLVGEEVDGMHIDMRAAMAGMMGGRGMMGKGGGMMDRDMRDMMKDMMGR
jgi:cytochrome c oxidase cbb3-type subunit I/II